MMQAGPRHDARDWVAVVLAIGISVCMAMLMFGVVYDAVRSDTPGISENATQIITTAFGGIIGVLGSYLGFKAGAQKEEGASNENSTRDNAGND